MFHPGPHILGQMEPATLFLQTCCGDGGPGVGSGSLRSQITA